MMPPNSQVQNPDLSQQTFCPAFRVVQVKDAELLSLLVPGRRDLRTWATEAGVGSLPELVLLAAAFRRVYTGYWAV